MKWHPPEYIIEIIRENKWDKTEIAAFALIHTLERNGLINTDDEALINALVDFHEIYTLMKDEAVDA